MTNPAFILSMIVGTIILLSVCYVYVKHKILNLGGVSFAAIGMILMGMSVWKTIDVSIDKDGFNAQLEQAIVSANEAIEQAESAKAMSKMTIEASLALKQSIETLKVQQKLKARRIYMGDVDGSLNPKTKDAIIRFQNTSGLAESGKIDDQTLDALKIKPIPNFPLFDIKPNKPLNSTPKNGAN